MTPLLPARLSDLFAAAKAVATAFNCSPEGIFDPCGLIMDIPPSTESYWCTPKGVHTFARTGGDGVHYSYFTVDASTESVTPIVMTRPAADIQNHIVAESFDEFFGLGFHVGWFALEQAFYDPVWAEAYFSTPEADANEFKAAALDFLRTQLEIKYVPLQHARLLALTAKYAEYIATPPLPSEA